jgi:hypothetical protein
MERTSPVRLPHSKSPPADTQLATFVLHRPFCAPQERCEKVLPSAHAPMRRAGLAPIGCAGDLDALRPWLELLSSVQRIVCGGRAAFYRGCIRSASVSKAFRAWYSQQNCPNCHHSGCRRAVPCFRWAREAFRRTSRLRHNRLC